MLRISAQYLCYITCYKRVFECKGLYHLKIIFSLFFRTPANPSRTFNSGTIHFFEKTYPTVRIFRSLVTNPPNSSLFDSLPNKFASQIKSQSLACHKMCFKSRTNRTENIAHDFSLSVSILNPLTFRELNVVEDLSKHCKDSFSFQFV